VCSATTRLLIEEPVHDLVVKQVADVLERLTPGTDYGPMITRGQHAKVLEHFGNARADGLSPLTGGDAVTEGPHAAGLYIRPTLYARVPPAARIAREEVFGPVLVSMPFADEHEAVRLANDTDYGLVAAVWSGDVARGLRVAEQIQAGQVAVNGGALSIETPFGGFKQSGYGREKGVEALHHYTQLKCVTVKV
jgi:aldehyde dehydrogenase (NAD+)